MRTLKLVVLSIVVFFTYSCSKEDNIHQKFAGPKLISRYQWIKADTTTGEFTQTIYDMDTMGRVILWDNASDAYNNARFYVNSLPAGFKLNNVGAMDEPIAWYADGKEGKTLTFFSEPNPGNVSYSIYSLKKKIGGKLILEAVYGYDKKNMYKEVIELSPL